MNPIDLVNEVHQLCIDPIMRDFVPDPFSLPNHFYYLNDEFVTFGRTRIYSQEMIKESIKKTNDVRKQLNKDLIERRRIMMALEFGHLVFMSPEAINAIEYRIFEAENYIGEPVRREIKSEVESDVECHPRYLLEDQCKDPTFEGNVCKLSLKDQYDSVGRLRVPAISWKNADEYMQLLIMLSVNAVMSNPIHFFKIDSQEINNSRVDSLDHIQKADAILEFLKENGEQYLKNGFALVRRFIDNPNSVDLSPEQRDYIINDLLNGDLLEAELQLAITEQLTLNTMFQEFEKNQKRLVTEGNQQSTKRELTNNQIITELAVLLQIYGVSAGDSKHQQEFDRIRLMNLMSNLLKTELNHFMAPMDTDVFNKKILLAAEVAYKIVAGSNSNYSHINKLEASDIETALLSAFQKTALENPQSPVNDQNNLPRETRIREIQENRVNIEQDLKKRAEQSGSGYMDRAAEAKKKCERAHSELAEKKAIEGKSRAEIEARIKESQGERDAKDSKERESKRSQEVNAANRFAIQQNNGRIANHIALLISQIPVGANAHPQANLLAAANNLAPANNAAVVNNLAAQGPVPQQPQPQGPSQQPQGSAQPQGQAQGQPILHAQNAQMTRAQLLIALNDARRAGPSGTALRNQIMVQLDDLAKGRP